jgi:hypothetical protein
MPTLVVASCRRLDGRRVLISSLLPVVAAVVAAAAAVAAVRGMLASALCSTQALVRL